MNPVYVTLVFIGYFLVLIGISRLVTKLRKRKDGAGDFAGFKSGVPWFVVAFGMIGTSLSGVTFVSVPGDVGAMTADLPHQPKGMTYFQVVLGYLLGYIFIALVLLPYYFRSNNRSIYSNLSGRLGLWAPRVAAGFFMIARLFGSSVRLFLTLSLVFSLFYSDSFIPFEVFAALSLVFIYLYSSKSGLNAIVWTDTVQTIIFLSVLIYLLFAISSRIGWQVVESSNLTQLVEWDPNRSHFFCKSVIAGFLICVAMTGLDQDMIQKSLMCASLRQAQTNMLVFAGLLLITNLLFLLLGVLVYEFAAAEGFELAGSTDRVLPEVMIHHLGAFSPVLLLLGLVSSSASSVDGTIAALSTTYYENFIQTNKPSRMQQRKTYLIISLLILLVIVAFYYFSASNSRFNVITLILSSASYIYSPVVGLFLYALIPGKVQPQINSWTFGILAGASLGSYLSIQYINSHFTYQIGFEAIAICSLIAYITLRLQAYLFHQKVDQSQ